MSSSLLSPFNDKNSVDVGSGNEVVREKVLVLLVGTILTLPLLVLCNVAWNAREACSIPSSTHKTATATCCGGAGATRPLMVVMARIFDLLTRGASAFYVLSDADSSDRRPYRTHRALVRT